MCLTAVLILPACAQTPAVTPTPTAAGRLHPLLEIVTPTAVGVTETPAPETAVPVWTTPLSGPVNVAPVVSGDLVIVATADGQITAVAAATGAPAWQFRPEGQLWDASLRVGEGVACFGWEGGHVTCLDGQTGKPLWTAVLAANMQSRPALVDGRLYAPTTWVGPGLENDFEGHAFLYALDVGTGEVAWETATDNYILRRPIVVGDLVITGGVYSSQTTDDAESPARIYAFAKQSGEVRWVHESADGLIRWLVATDEVIAFAGHSELVRGLNPATGELMWSFGPGFWMQFPATADGVLYLGTGDERFHALDGASGQHLWESSIDLDSLNQIGRPFIRDDLVLFNAVTGDIYGLRLSDGTQTLHLETDLTARVGGALFEDLYIIGDAEGLLHAYKIH